MAGISPLIKQVAEATGKSIDEVMEMARKLSKKASDSADEVSDSARLSNLTKEAKDASVPMGSGKNLDALEKARAEAPDLNKIKADELNKVELDEMVEGSKNAPYVDNELNVNKDNLGLSFDDANPANYSPTSLTKEIKNPTNYLTPTGLKSSEVNFSGKPSMDDMVEQLKGVITPAKKVSNKEAIEALINANKKKTIAGVTLGGGLLANKLTGGSETPVMMTPPPGIAKQAEQPVMSDELNAAAMDEADSQTGPTPITPARRSLGVDLAGQIEAGAPEAPPAPQEPDFLKMLEDAQEQSKYRTAGANFLRGAEQAGAGLSRTKAEHSGSKSALEQAGQPLEDVRATIGAHKEQMSFNKVKEEANDEAKLRDPNSEISKFYREKFGPFIPGIKETTSAADMTKAIPQLTQLINTREAANSRKESADLQREYLSDNKQTQGLNKHIDTYNKSLQKNYDDLTKTQANISAMDTIMSDAKNGVTPGAKDVSLLYSFISGLDPASTVREGEVQLSKGAMSLWGKIKSGAKRITGGDLLDQDTRNSFMEIMRAGAKAQENRFRKSKINAVNAGKEKKYDPEVLNRAMYGDVDVLGKDKSLESGPLTTPNVDDESVSLARQKRIAELKAKAGN